MEWCSMLRKAIVCGYCVATQDVILKRIVWYGMVQYAALVCGYCVATLDVILKRMVCIEWCSMLH